MPVRRLADALTARGHVLPANGRVPLKRQYTGNEGGWRCWKIWNIPTNEWETWEEGREVVDPPISCSFDNNLPNNNGYRQHTRRLRHTEWGLMDINGDGLLDVIMNGRPVVNKTKFHRPMAPPWERGCDNAECYDTQNLGMVTVGVEHEEGPLPTIDVLYNVAGMRLGSGVYPFSLAQPWTTTKEFISHEPTRTGELLAVRTVLGFETWMEQQASWDANDIVSEMISGVLDVNGDGLADRNSNM